MAVMLLMQIVVFQAVVAVHLLLAEVSREPYQAQVVMDNLTQ
jgi:hypothetical protein